jgi:hypothetical protein
VIRDIVPARYRKAIYTALSAAYALELIFDVVPEGTQTKLIQALAVLGFTLAAGNTDKQEEG